MKEVESRCRILRYLRHLQVPVECDDDHAWQHHVLPSTRAGRRFALPFSDPSLEHCEADGEPSYSVKMKIVVCSSPEGSSGTSHQTFGDSRRWKGLHR